jgi:hypothetical protein
VRNYFRQQSAIARDAHQQGAVICMNLVTLALPHELKHINCNHSIERHETSYGSQLLSLKFWRRGLGDQVHTQSCIQENKGALHMLRSAGRLPAGCRVPYRGKPFLKNQTMRPNDRWDRQPLGQAKVVAETLCWPLACQTEAPLVIVGICLPDFSN